MDAGDLPGSLAWLAIGLGYAWTVRKLSRMARTPETRDTGKLDYKLTIPVDGLPVRRHAEQCVAPARDDVAEPQARAELYRRA